MTGEEKSSLLEAIHCYLGEKGDGWDQPADFLFVMEDHGSWQLESLGLPLSLLGNPAELLAQVSKTMASVAGIFPGAIPDPPPGFRGVALFTEGWIVEQDLTGGQEPDPVLDAMAREHLLHEHPDRAEVRNLWAAVDDGSFASVTIGRDGITRLDTVTEPGDPDRQEGRVPDALRLITRTVTDASEKRRASQQ